MSSVPALVDTIRQAQSIQLSIPDTLPSGKNWAPHQFSPSVQLVRIDEADANVDQLPRKEVTPGSSVSLEMELGEYIGKMRFVDVYRIAPAVDATSSSPLVAKIIDLGFFSPSVPPTRDDVEEVIANEFHFFNVLAPIQGTVVPRLAGLFGKGLLYCAIYEDGGRRLTWEEKEDSEIGDRFLSAVRTIHAAGVAYGPEYSHSACIDDDGAIKIVDFENSATLAVFTHKVLANLAEMDEDSGGMTPEQRLERAYEAGMCDALRFLGRDSRSPSPTPSASPSPP